MSVLYQKFSIGDLDFSDDSLISLYNHESYGTELSPRNGFAVGKKYLNLQIAMWREDIKLGLLRKYELAEDYPDWFLESALKNCVVNPFNEWDPRLLGLQGEKNDDVHQGDE